MKRPNLKPPGFIAARAALYLVGAASAAFGVAGWLLPVDWSAIPWQAIGLGVMTALSALVVPTCVEIVGRGLWSFLLLPAAGVFALINAYSFHNAVDSLVEAPRRAAHHAEFVAGPAKAYAEARTAVLNHAPPVFPADMITPRRKAETEAWQLVQTALERAQALAKADLDAAPAYTPMASGEVVWGVALAIDAALALALGGIALVRGAIARRLTAEKAAKAKAAAKRRLAPKAAKLPKVRLPADVLTPAEHAALIRHMPRQFRVV